MTDEKPLYIKSDNAGLIYENIRLTTINDNNGTTINGQIDVMYAPDSAGSPGTYVQSLSIASGPYTTALKIWRKVISLTFRVTLKRQILLTKLQQMST